MADFVKDAEGALGNQNSSGGDAEKAMTGGSGGGGGGGGNAMDQEVNQGMLHPLSLLSYSAFKRQRDGDTEILWDGC